MSDATPGPEIPEDFIIELDGEDGDEVEAVDLENLWESGPPEGYEEHEGEIPIPRPEDTGSHRFRIACAGMLASSLLANSQTSMATYYICAHADAEAGDVVEHVQAILTRASIPFHMVDGPLAEEYVGKIRGPSAALDAIASSPGSLIRRVTQIPPQDLTECLGVILSASESNETVLHELAWAAAIRLYQQLRPVIDLVPPALDEVREKLRGGGAPFPGIPMPEEFGSRLHSVNWMTGATATRVD